MPMPRVGCLNTTRSSASANAGMLTMRLALVRTPSWNAKPTAVFVARQIPRSSALMIVAFAGLCASLASAETVSRNRRESACIVAFAPDDIDLVAGGGLPELCHEQVPLSAVYPTKTVAEGLSRLGSLPASKRLSGYRIGRIGLFESTPGHSRDPGSPRLAGTAG